MLWGCHKILYRNTRLYVIPALVRVMYRRIFSLKKEEAILYCEQGIAL